MPKPSLWKSESNFFSAEDYFQSLLEGIENARRSIFLETYIFDFDELGKKVIDKLVDAKERGVEIRVLVDGIGAMNDISQIMDKFKAHKLPIRIYHPLPWNFRSYRYAIKKGGFFEKLLHFTGHINHRDHRKLCIIDNQFAWTGSFNISSSHLKKENGGDDWKDHGIKVSGENVQHLSDEFLHLWDHDGSVSKRTFNGKALPFILSSLNPLKRRQKIYRLSQGINRAKERIWIANAYFAPHRSIVTALVNAKHRGVDVKILVGGKSDIFFFPSLTRSFYADFVSCDVGIYEWGETVLHSKIVLIDDYCYTGSSNLNSRSFYHDLELDILLCEQKTIEEVQQQLIKDFSSSKTVEKSWLYENTVYILLMSFFPKLLRYWL